ncbi:MAG: gliding motility-associated C-terminal domain-containing protein [Saprospiraceae bacterium]|nr:gliding motility-associated C-terminal domain-containing protein [Saprospiraceae bacterium]
MNDDFRVFPGQNFEMLTFEFRVFDRWGDAMFTTFDPADGWDGVFREIERQPDVYVWFVKATVLVCGTRKVDVFREGGVTIMR